MRKIIRLTVLGAGLALGSGCAISVKLPANRMDSPETTGKQWRMSLEGGLVGQNEAVLTDDVLLLSAGSVPNTVTPRMERSIDPRLGFGLGLHERFDVSARMPGNLQVKYQPIGASRLVAEEGNISLAITLGVGSQDSTDSGTPLFSTERRVVKVKETLFDAAIIAGYRKNPSVLFYGGVFGGTDSVSGTLDSIPASGATTTTAFAGEARSFGTNLGVELGSKDAHVRIEAAVARMSMGERARIAPYVGLTLSGAFN